MGMDPYEAACKLDVNLQTLNATLQARTSSFISSLAAGARSFNSLQEITECLLEMNQEDEVVKVILDCKNEIWKNQDLLEDYFDNSQKTLDFCAALDKCLKSATYSLGEVPEELKSFKNTFTDEFSTIFQSLYSQQTAMRERLESKESKLDKNLKSIHLWQMVSIIIFIFTFSAVLISSVVAAVVAAHPVAAALAVATSIPLGSMGKWIDTLFKNYMNAAQGQREVVNSMIAGTCVTVDDLGSIRVLVDKLENEIESLLISSDFSSKRLAALSNYVEELGAQAVYCIRNIQRARPLILKRIIKHPNYSG